jgi:hypothetical protein
MTGATKRRLQPTPPSSEARALVKLFAVLVEIASSPIQHESTNHVDERAVESEVGA